MACAVQARMDALRFSQARGNIEQVSEPDRTMHNSGLIFNMSTNFCLSIGAVLHHQQQK